MGKTMLLVRSNMRGKKGQAAVIAILMLLAAFMLHLWLMLETDYKQNFKRCHDRQKDGHVTLAVDGDLGKLRQFLGQTMAQDGRVDAYSLDDAMHMVGVFEYGGGKVNANLVFLEKEAACSRPVGKMEIVEEGRLKSGVYLPILYQSEDVAVGKEITVFIGSVPVSYTVCGFFNSAMAGSHNCGVCAFLLTEDKYRELEGLGCAPKSLLCSVRLKDSEESERYEVALKNAVSEREPDAQMVSNSYALVSTSRYISQMICSGIIRAMAFAVLVIAVVVIASNIDNQIREKMKDFGALKAIGYTGRQLVSSLLLQFVGISAAAAAAGAVLSGAVFPQISRLLDAQTGIPYQMRVRPLPYLAAPLLLGGMAALAVLASSRKIKRLEPIVALRQGILSHNFKRNHLPLETAKAPLTLALALKTTLSGMKQNAILCLTMFALSLIVVFSGMMAENVIADITPFLDLVMGETADSCVNVSARAEKEFLREMKADRRVKDIYLFHTQEVRHVGGLALSATISEDFSGIGESIVFRGRAPKYENEIAVAAKYAGEAGLEIGMEAAITVNGKKETYLITGFTQMSNMLGKDCLLTRAGYERLGALENASYYLNFAEGTDIEAFHSEVRQKFFGDVNATINIEETVQGASSVYVSLITVIVAAILALGAALVVFVLFLLVRTELGNKRRDYGILKALGCTTGQLVMQTALSFLPVVAASTAVGLAASCLVMNPLMALFLKGIGIVKCTFSIPYGFVIAAGAGMALFAFAVTCALSLNIKEIAPKELLLGE